MSPKVINSITAGHYYSQLMTTALLTTAGQLLHGSVSMGSWACRVLQLAYRTCLLICKAGYSPKEADFNLPHLCLAWRWFCSNFAVIFVVRKLGFLGYCPALFVWFYVYPFDAIPGCDTHRQTHDDGIYRASIASRGKDASRTYSRAGRHAWRAKWSEVRWDGVVLWTVLVSVNEWLNEWSCGGVWCCM